MSVVRRAGISGLERGRAAEGVTGPGVGDEGAGCVRSPNKYPLGGRFIMSEGL